MPLKKATTDVQLGPIILNVIAVLAKRILSSFAYLALNGAGVNGASNT